MFPGAVRFDQPLNVGKPIFDPSKVDMSGMFLGPLFNAPSVPLAVALGATCTLDMTDSYGDGWNGAEWAAPGFGQSFSLADGYQGTRSFVVQFQQTAPPSPPPSPPGTFTTKNALKMAVQAYDADVASAEATYGPIADWDVSAITDMSWLFYDHSHPHRTNFNADITSWDTSSVTNMESMFYVRSARAPAPQLATLPPLGPHQTPRPHRMPLLSTRQSAPAFNQPLSFDTSSVTDMSDMFYVRSAPAPQPSLRPSLYAPLAPPPLHALPPPPAAPHPASYAPLSTRQVAPAFNQPLSFDTSSVADMNNMFYVRSAHAL